MTYRLAVWLAWGLVCHSVLAATTCVKSVRVPDAAPYAYHDNNGNLRGLHVDLIREALGRMQCEARFVDMPWARALVEMRSGALDLLPGAADTQERREFAFFSRPTNSARSVVFVRSDYLKKFNITRLDAIAETDFRLAVRRGAIYSEAYESLLKQPSFVRRLSFVPSAKTGLLMLAAGRVDGMIADELTGLRMIAQLELKNTVQRSGLVISSEADLVAIGKATNNDAFVQKFNASLGSMMGDGTYIRILQRYMPCPVSLERLGCR